MSPVLLFGLLAAAVPPVAVTGDCPGAEAVTAALRSALGNDAKIDVPETPRVSDQGDRFSVAAAGQVQQYADPGRDCDERARAAAVFIALALNPPLAPPGPAPARPEGALQVTAPPPPETSPRWLELAVAARADGGPGQAVGPAIGAELQAGAGWRWVGVAATAGILAPSEGAYSSVTVRQQRFPLSLALTARHRLSQRLAIAGAAGAALVPLTFRAPALEGGPSATRLDAGIRLAFQLKIRATQRLAPFVDLHAEFFPRAYELQVGPVGTIGSTGRFWLGVSAGVSFDALQPRS